jgi:hypothetical protein
MPVAFLASLLWGLENDVLILSYRKPRALPPGHSSHWWQNAARVPTSGRSGGMRCCGWTRYRRTDTDFIVKSITASVCATNNIRANRWMTSRRTRRSRPFSRKCGFAAWSSGLLRRLGIVGPQKKYFAGIAAKNAFLTCRSGPFGPRLLTAPQASAGDF